MQEQTLYTITVFSENTVGVLNQIAAILTRRQMNIETLSVSPSAISGIHKFTITTYASHEDAMKKLQDMIDSSNRIVFFGGAGVSTESGIPDFRSVDGLYNQKYDHPPEVMLSHTFYKKHPAIL